MELKELLCSLGERLLQHDNNRKDVQNSLREACVVMTEEANSLEEKLCEELQASYSSTEERILSLIEKLNNKDEEEKIMCVFIKRAQEVLLYEPKYRVEHIEEARGFIGSVRLVSLKVKNDPDIKDKNDPKEISKLLKVHLDAIHSHITVVQKTIEGICTERRSEANKLKKRINEELETLFNQEDRRIQEVVSYINEKSNEEDNEEELKTRAKLTLLENQKYSLDSDNNLVVKREASLEWIDFGKRKSSNLSVSFTNKGELFLSFAFLNDDEINILKATGLIFKVTIKVWEKGKSEKEDSKIITKEYSVGEPICFAESFRPSTTYCLKSRIEHQELLTEWSQEVEFTPEFKELCVWKECPDYENEKHKYYVDKNNPRIASMKAQFFHIFTIIGNTLLPPNKVTSWSIKILNSKRNGYGILIGVAPFNISQYYDNNDQCGWYFECCESTLHSGPPHNYFFLRYGPRKEKGEYVHEGDSVGVVMDTTKGELSFVVNGVNFGAAYEGVPLDKPLVPCVLLRFDDSSVELDPSEVKENVNVSIPVPPNITVKSDTWDSITLTWDNVEGAEFYQIEIDENKKWYVSTTNRFTKWRLLPESEHSFKMRTVKGTSVSEWSDVVRGKTVKIPQDFAECTWRECPEYVDDIRKYYFNEDNHRIITKTNDDRNLGGSYCTVIGNAPLPLNKVTSWNIKILKSRDNKCDSIYIGVTPFDIDQSVDNNYRKCGWYYYCYESTLISGPPYNYKWPGKNHGPRKKGGEYVRTGSNVGVIMDMTKGELSFDLDGINNGVAFKEIPLDKPLVPCVILFHKGDSVELII